MSALYNSYRPQSFGEMIGQERIVRTLQNAVSREKVAHAYIFAGPRGTGKTSTARILAKALNCLHGPTPEPDTSCRVCLAIASGTALDVIEQDAASQRGIDDIREVRSRVYLQPVEGKAKIYIFDEAHQLTDAAWNALLKLIEEPPAHLVFIFATTALEKVPATVRSRCQTFLFAAPTAAELLTYLRRVADGEKVEVSDEALALVADRASGSFRDAASLFEQLIAAADDGAITIEVARELLHVTSSESLTRLTDALALMQTGEALAVVEELARDGADFERVAADLLEHLRRLSLVKHLGALPETVASSAESSAALAEQAERVDGRVIARAMETLLETVRIGATRMTFELALLNASLPSEQQAVLDQLAKLERFLGDQG